VGRLQDRLEKLKAGIRAKVEHPFHVIKNLFRHRKTRYRGLAKNEAQLFSLFGFANWCSPTAGCQRFMAEVCPEGGIRG
jgi:IS5 family transposase